MLFRSYAYALALDQELVGCIILFLSPDRANDGMLGCLFIDPTHHHKGLGKAAWFQAEAMFPQVRVWHTETPARSYRNHCFYINTCGFHVVHVNDPQNISQAQFVLEKRL